MTGITEDCDLDHNPGRTFGDSANFALQIGKSIIESKLQLISCIIPVENQIEPSVLHPFGRLVSGSTVLPDVREKK